MTDAVLKIFVLFLLCLMFFCIVLFYFLLKKRENEIYEAEEMLADILECVTRGTVERDQWNGFKKQYEENQREGAIGRLYSRIWETAQIINREEKKRKEEQDYLKNLMSDISHQMKTPLASLRVFVDIFSEDEKKGELARMADKQLDRMHWLITGLLKLARIESGTYVIGLKEQSLIQTVQRSVDALKIKISQKDIKIKIIENVISDKEIFLYHDADWMEEAYINLLKNAIKYAPVGSEIVIQMDETPMAVMVSVEDRGEGIPQEELPKIFNRFYCVHRIGQGQEGVGIGLALAKSIVEANGGIITVYSRQGKESYTRFVTTFVKSHPATALPSRASNTPCQ